MICSILTGVLLNEDRCLGCGVCVRNSNNKSIILKSRPKRVLPVLNGLLKAVVMAIERGKLLYLILDNRVFYSHRTMAAVLGVILRLPPVKQAKASHQIKWRYCERLIIRLNTGWFAASSRHKCGEDKIVFRR